MLMLLLVFQIVSAQSNLRGPASSHLLDETNPKIFDMKKATFQDCDQEVAKKKVSEKFNFLDRCITFASGNLKKGSDPRACLKTAVLVAADDIKILVKRCMSELGYDLCKVDTPSTDFRGRLDCIHKYKDSMDYTDCEPDIQEIQKVMSLTKADLKLGKNHASILQKGFCQKPSQALPPSVTPGGMPSQR